MPLRTRHGLFIGVALTFLLFATWPISYAETVNYIYDELNRLIRVEYADGTKIQYVYDKGGNRSHVFVGKYSLSINIVGSGTVTKNPDQPFYSEGTSVTLTASAGSASFSAWSGDLTGSANPATIVMNGNRSVTATFETRLPGWAYRKAVTLSRASGSVTDYQMKLLVGETSGASGEDVDCNGHVQPDFDDLRFTKSDGTTLLDYWIESITGTSPNRLATVWIKFDAIGTGATAFYMYYGKADAPATSNGEASFLFFDDFSGSALDSGKWTVEQGDITVGSGIATLSGTTATRGYVKTAPIGGINMAARFRMKTSSNLIANGHPVDFRIDGNNLIYFFGTGTANSLTVSTYSDGSYSQSYFSVGDPSVNYECWDLTWISNEVKVVQSGTTRLTKTSNIPTSGSPIMYMREGTVPGQNIQMDWLLLRNFVSSEPIWGGWGAEQTN
jgi:YD repeat-containing protein